MYKIAVQGNFSSAHNLRNYHGQCEKLHGHNWKVEVQCRADALDSSGMLLDFRILKEKLNQVLKEIDHCYLNEQKAFLSVNPTAENIAGFIYKQLKTGVPLLSRVIIWESENSRAEYCESI
ncbi:MAG: 6-carboxytetrahydropterin synthase QueD [Spirochaetes bacterium GWF1_41_5]|nr:MAG: 6-carboxytetrahydropterin synthase QueD [Spirochaetes bacterium GWF1_41_5]HBE03241.1 6-carboxytetrahydropterin synthase QueD [Spirochaetia bacterium]